MKTEWILYLTIVPAAVIMLMNLSCYTTLVWATVVKKRLSTKMQVNHKLSGI